MSAHLYIDVQTVRAAIERLKLEFPELSEDAELLADMLEGSTDLHELLTRIVREEREAAAFSQALKAEEEALAGRRSRFTKRQEMSRAMIQSLMETASQTKLVLPTATISMSAGRKACQITDEALLPDEYVKVSRTPKRQEITMALAQGKDISGAYLRNSPPHLTIRT